MGPSPQSADFDPGLVDALVFDVIGTLVDEEGAVATMADRLAREAGVDAGVDLATRWAEGLDRRMAAVVAGEVAAGPHQDLVTAAAEEAVVAGGGRWSASAAALVATADREYLAWPEVADATADLRRRFLLAGLSNGDLDALAHLAHRNAIAWDVVLSTGSISTFKPAPAAYRYAIDALRLEPDRTLFVAAHPWDLRAAAEHGFRTAYVARPGAGGPEPGDRFDLEVDDLTGLVAALPAAPWPAGGESSAGLGPRPRP